LLIELSHHQPRDVPGESLRVSRHVARSAIVEPVPPSPPRSRSEINRGVLEVPA
jgi:hypothetical protein